MLPIEFGGFFFDAYAFQKSFTEWPKIIFWALSGFFFLFAFLANIYKSFLVQDRSNINNQKILSEFSRIVNSKISFINSLDDSGSMKKSLKLLGQKTLLFDAIKILNQAKKKTFKLT